MPESPVLNKISQELFAIAGICIAVVQETSQEKQQQFTKDVEQRKLLFIDLLNGAKEKGVINSETSHSKSKA